MTTVVNINDERCEVYIGRPTIWGNPYSHLDGTLAEYKVETRAEAIEKYKEHFYNSPELMSRLEELRGKVLGCHCKPVACHGDFLAKLCNEKLQLRVDLEDL